MKDWLLWKFAPLLAWWERRRLNRRRSRHTFLGSSVKTAQRDRARFTTLSGANYENGGLVQRDRIGLDEFMGGEPLPYCAHDWVLNPMSPYVDGCVKCGGTRTRPIGSKP